MARAWHLMNRPTGIPTAEDAVLRDIPLAELDEGMVHVRNRWLSVDPYMALLGVAAAKEATKPGLHCKQDVVGWVDGRGRWVQANSGKCE